MKTLLRRGALGLTAGALSFAGLMPAAHARAGAPVPIADAGSVVAWGNYPEETTIPAALDGVPVTAIAGGPNYSLALTAGGNVVAWGRSGAGAPLTVPSGLTHVTAIAAGGTSAVALKSDGTVAAWGAETSGIPNVPAGLDHVVSIDASTASVAAAVKSDGTVVEWGTATTATTSAWKVPTTLPPVTQVALGTAHALALTSDHHVVAWGSSIQGNITIPSDIQGHVIAVAAGGFTSAALLEDHTVRVWGADAATPVPTGLAGQQVTDLDVATASGGPVIASTASGEVFSWGGSGTDTTAMTTVPTDLDGQPVVAVAEGGTQGLALVTSYRTLTEPAITGTPKFGQTLTLAPATFSLKPDSVSTQWLANGAPIAGATGATLALTADQVGKRISVAQTAVRGTETLTSTSPAVGPVAKAEATLAVKVSPKKLTKAKLKKAKAKVTVSAQGNTPTGTVTIYFKHKRVAAAALSNGKATLRLKKLKKLAKNKVKLKLQIRYGGDGNTNTATTNTTIKLKH
jgi:hypothetical protein